VLLSGTPMQNHLDEVRLFVLLYPHYQMVLSALCIDFPFSRHGYNELHCVQQMLLRQCAIANVRHVPRHTQARTS
jgi:hypothetical protein